MDCARIGEEAPHTAGDEELIDIATGIDPKPHGSLESQEAAAADVVPPQGIYTTLCVFVLLKLLLSFDSGAFSSSLTIEGGIAEDLELTSSEQGWLGSSVFLGNMLGCAVAGQMFAVYSAQKLLLWSVIFHGIFTFLFAASSIFIVSVLIRFFIGLTLAFVVVYTPIWVEEFAPRKSATTWMALCNVGVPIGVMLGFIAGGLVPVYTSLSWRSSFYFKCIILIPLALFAANADSSLINSKGRTVALGDDQEGSRVVNAVAQATIFVSNFQKYCSELSVTSVQLFRTPIFTFNVLALSMMYFVVTALQNFVTPYLRGEPFNTGLNTVIIGFGLSVVTAPVVGVIAGGIIMDRMGGYHGNFSKASAFSLLCGAAASIVGIFCILAETTVAFLIPMWVVLCVGGAIVPVSMGLTMASIPPALRPMASSSSNIAYNFLGYFLGPLVCGYIIEWSSLQWGIRSCLSVSWVGLAFMFCAYWSAKAQEATAIANDVAQFQMSSGGSVITQASVSVPDSIDC